MIIQKIDNGMSEALIGLGLGSARLGSQLSQVDTIFRNNRWYLISNMRQLLSNIYVEHGIIQTIIDLPVEDAFRGGIDIKTDQLSPEEIKDLISEIEEDGTLDTAEQGFKWKRLFGGSGIVIMTDQSPSTPLNLNSIKEGSRLGFRAVDMWELFYSHQSTDDYSLAISQNDFEAEYYDYYGIRLHKSRVLKIVGQTAPSFIRPRLRGWGLSVIEALIRSINQYLKSDDLLFEVLDEFKVDYFKFKGLNRLTATKDGIEHIKRRVNIANSEKNFMNAVTLDTEDEFGSKELSFGGISEVMNGIRMKVAADLRMPMSKIFGISSTGFSSGQDDIENYNGMIESSIRRKAKPITVKLVKLKCKKKFGFIPDDLSIEFKPLRILSAEQEENVKTFRFNRDLAATQAGLMTVREFKEGCNKNGLLSVQLDTSNEEVMPLTGGEEVKTKTDTVAPAKGPRVVNEETAPRIVVVGVISGDEILTGQRRDNGLWTCPGGHWEGDRSAEEAACREVQEETGIYITPLDLEKLPVKELTSHRTGKKFFVHPYLARVEKVMPRTTQDPDSEFQIIKWVKIDPESHELRPENRHAERDLILEHLFKGDKK